MSANKRFEGKTVIVTGAGSGIGKATAARLINEGCSVVATDVSEDRLEEFKAEFPSADLKTVTGDICDDAVIQQIVGLRIHRSMVSSTTPGSWMDSCRMPKSTMPLGSASWRLMSPR